MTKQRAIFVFCFIHYPCRMAFSVFRIVFFSMGCCVLASPMASASPGVAYLINLRGVVSSNTVHYVNQELSKAEGHDARIVVLEIRTREGSLSAAKKIVHAILHSSVPVAGLVYPGGTQLGLSGFYILSACPVVAMEPSSYLDLNAARFLKKSKGSSVRSSQALAEATTALHALALHYGRADPWDEGALRQGVHLSGIKAKKLGVIDLLVTSPQALLFALDGRRIRGLTGWQILSTSKLVLEQGSQKGQVHMQSMMANPNFIYLLLIVGIFGILFELAGPGLILPGIVGTVSLVLAIYALQGVSIDYGGLGLMIAGVGLMVWASYLNRLKLLGIGGIVAFATGSILLFDIRGNQVSLVMVGGLAVVSAALFWSLSRRLISLRRRGAISGREVIVGSHATVVRDFVGQGQIHLNGELWQATSKQPLHRGQRVRVVGINDLILEVVPEEK